MTASKEFLSHNNEISVKSTGAVRYWNKIEIRPRKARDKRPSITSEVRQINSVESKL